MKQKNFDSYRRELRRRRAELLRRVARTEAKLAELREEREREWSEEALEERMSHLLNQTTEDWHTRLVTLSATKGLSERCFASLSMTVPS